MEREILTTHRKALRLNLNPVVYGSFAEIGGGQEVARTFFQAGGASGTIARTISAYDMSFSDEIYGKSPSKRYVSKERLEQMLDFEFDSVAEILAKKRGKNTCFFAFANTVTTLNFRKNNVSHGWIGMKFQLNPMSEPNSVVLHVKLLENENLLQQKTLGVLGVNLIFACFYHYETPNTFLQSLMDNLSPAQIEVNMIEMKGKELGYVDNRLLSVQLVKNGMTPATLFDRYGKVHQPADMLYKKNILVLRGSFRPITYVGYDMLKTSFGLFKKDEDYTKETTFAFCEITLNNLLESGEFDERDFLARVDQLNDIGQNVMITNFKEFYKLVDHLSAYRFKNLRIIIGVLTFRKVMDEQFYKSLTGGILEAFGKLFPEKMKLYLYPTRDGENGQIKTSANIKVPEKIEYLYKHLLQNRKILDVPNVKKERLHIRSQSVLNGICNKEEGWENLVPKYISNTIKAKKLYGY
ncbi:MAG: TonB-dependent receptor [Bacteroidota bacterium]|nr:TonB-dependent receptor [Bacteroidota bacterium]